MSKYIKKNDLLPLVESHFHEYLSNSEYELQFKPAIELLTWNRLDLAFKLLYLDHKSNCITFAEEIYNEHIEALTLGSYKEPGNSEKNSAKRFLDEFERTYQAISTTGFDHEQSLIPLTSSGAIANGAHRVASAIKANKAVACVNIETGIHQYDYKFFYGRNVSTSSIEAAVSKFIEKAPNVYIALVWPSAVGRDDELIRFIPNVIYRKDVKLTRTGGKNLLVKVYHSETWLGNHENKFKGVQGKLVECFKTSNPMRVIAFQAESYDEVLSIKEKIREVFQIDKHSVHITDTDSDALRVSRLLFNENSVHFLNYADPYKYSHNHLEIEKIHRFFENSGLGPGDILIDGSLLLSLYGIRKNQDIDYLTMGDVNEKSPSMPGINNHNEDAHYHGRDTNTLIVNPHFHFYYEGIKFISFPQLYRMKKDRGENKDIIDAEMMEAFLDNSTWRGRLLALLQSLEYSKIKVKIKLITILKWLKLDGPVRNVYRKLK